MRRLWIRVPVGSPRKRKVENRPTIGELKIMLKNSSLEAIGRKYGVTGNSIKKWLK